MTLKTRLAQTVDALFGVDLRSLALFRIAVALVLLADLAIRATDLVAHYTDAGVLPRATLLATARFARYAPLYLLSGSPTWGLGGWLSTYPALGSLFALGLPVVTAVEVCAPACLFSRRFRQAFLAVMVPFHVLSWVFLDVWFWENLLLYALLLDGSRDRVRVAAA